MKSPDKQIIPPNTPMAKGLVDLFNYLHSELDNKDITAIRPAIISAFPSFFDFVFLIKGNINIMLI